MTYEYNKEAFKEQEKFLKMLAKKLKLDDYKCLGSYLCNCKIEKKDFLNKQLIKYINDGKLTNWLVNEVKEKSIKEIEELINIDYFWKCYSNTLAAMGIDVPNYVLRGRTLAEEKKILAKIRRCVFSNSICEFHEAQNPQSIGYNPDDDGSTVFSYTETRRII